MTGSRKQPTWTVLKNKLVALDHQELLTLIKDLYAAHKDNQTFLNLYGGKATTGAGTLAMSLMT
jgi:hypothetical protein